MRGRLVEDEQSRPLRERAGKHDALALPARKAIEGLSGKRLHPGERHRLAGNLEIVPALEEAARRVGEPTHQHELFDGVRKALRHVLGHDGDLPGNRRPSEPL